MVDPYSRFLGDFYGGIRIDDHSNIIFANGLLDPWSAAGVYPAQDRSGSAINNERCKMQVFGIDPKPKSFEYDCSMVRNVTEDGGIVALILDLGAHHLDLMYSDDRDPSCAREARLIEEVYIFSWIQEWRAKKNKFERSVFHSAIEVKISVN